MRNDAAMASVMGIPRSRRTTFGSLTGDRWVADEGGGATRRVPGMGTAGPRARLATTAPSTNGTTMARPIQTPRTSQLGTHGGKYAKVRATAARRGHIALRIRSGQAAAAPTRAESHTFSRGLVGPKSATTAQPKSAERMLPSDRDMRERIACRI